MSEMDIEQESAASPQVIGTSVYNFYKHSKLSKYSWPKDRDVDAEQQHSHTSEDMQRDLDGASEDKSQDSEVYRLQSDQLRRDSSSSDDSLEDEDYQIMRDSGPTRRKRSRSTPNAPLELYPMNILSSPAEAPAALGSTGTRKVRLCEFCNASDTPMWRRGPSGKGTLCNACGVKWSLNIRKRNSKKETNQINTTSTTARRVSPNGKNMAEQKSTGKARRSSGQRHSRVDGRDEEFTEDSEEDSSSSSVDTKEYFCGYCNTSWPAGHFKNIQQFGAHCSNCSRKHPKVTEAHEESGVKRKFEEDSMDTHPSSDLGGLITAVENQLLEEHEPKRQDEPVTPVTNVNVTDPILESMRIIKDDVADYVRKTSDTERMTEELLIELRRKLEQAKREAIQATVMCESAHRETYQNSSSDMDNTIIANHGDEPHHALPLAYKLQKIIEDKFEQVETRLSESLVYFQKMNGGGSSNRYNVLLRHIDDLQTEIEQKIPR